MTFSEREGFLVVASAVNEKYCGSIWIAGGLPNNRLAPKQCILHDQPTFSWLQPSLIASRRVLQKAPKGTQSLKKALQNAPKKLDSAPKSSKGSARATRSWRSIHVLFVASAVNAKCCLQPVPAPAPRATLPRTGAPPRRTPRVAATASPHTYARRISTDIRMCAAFSAVGQG